jgi:hydroxymethylpyrimidine pyrophosphatase-like HAD family hydrolase
MLTRVGLGVAMPQSPPVVRSAAKHVADSTLADFIHELVAGRFD